MSKFINLKGQRFERLLVKELVSLGMVLYGNVNVIVVK